MHIREIRSTDDAAIAEIVRYNLKKHGLDLPGTVYFDKELDCLSHFYLSSDRRIYYIMLNEQEKIVGGIGLAEFDGLKECAELQKLYLIDEVKGNGLGYELIRLIIRTAADMGYRQMYLETHTNLKAAIHMYEKTGFKEIERPPVCVHTTMNKFYLLDLPFPE